MTKLSERLAELSGKATPGDWQYHMSHLYGPDPDRALIGQLINAPWLVSDRELIVELVNAYRAGRLIVKD